MRITHLAAALFAGVLAACASGPDPYSGSRYGDAGYYPTEFGRVVGIQVGNEVEPSHRSAGVDEYRIAVRLDRGGTRTVVLGGLGDVRVGDRVRIENGRVFRG